MCYFVVISMTNKTRKKVVQELNAAFGKQKLPLCTVNTVHFCICLWPCPCLCSCCYVTCRPARPRARIWERRSAGSRSSISETRAAVLGVAVVLCNWIAIKKCNFIVFFCVLFGVEVTHHLSNFLNPLSVRPSKSPLIRRTLLVQELERSPP